MNKSTKDTAIMRQSIILAALLALMFLLPATGAAQERLTDTLRVASTSIYPGDTGAVYIYFANSEPLGGYALRIEYDTSIFGVVKIAGGDDVVEAVQLRGNLESFLFAEPDPGVITGIAYTWDRYTSRLEAGQGNTVLLRFYAKEYAVEGVSSPVDFVDHPTIPQTWNSFSDAEGLIHWRPVTVPGFITIGEAQILSIVCPNDVTIDCDAPTDPDFTGAAIASDPSATITYQDEITPGTCSDDFNIERTWTASLGGQDALCTQMISVRDSEPPAMSCPKDVNVEFGLSTEPDNTGFTSAVDNCDQLPVVSHSDVETAGEHPIHRRIVRTWRAADACGNSNECVQLIYELAEGVSDTTTVSSGDGGGAVLHQNWPNPFLIGPGNEDSIKYYVPRAGRVELSIYDVVGRCLKTLVDQVADSAGTFTVAWDGRDADGKYVPSGIYLYRLEFDGRSIMKKMAVIR